MDDAVALFLDRLLRLRHRPAICSGSSRERDGGPRRGGPVGTGLRGDLSRRCKARADRHLRGGRGLRHRVRLWLAPGRLHSDHPDGPVVRAPHRPLDGGPARKRPRGHVRKRNARPRTGGTVTGVSVACPAKVNLFLRILAREDTGYHQIETLFQAIGLFDRVEVRRQTSTGISLEIRRRESVAGSGDVIGDLGQPEQNTVMKAAQAFFATTGITPSVSMSLTKRIPAGTGLGGGSSDGAGTLAALNLLYGRPLTRSDLIELGGRIGSDVPFFCARVPAALAWGRGDRLLPCPPPPAARIVVVVPRDRANTAAGYREASAGLEFPAASVMLDGMDSADWRHLASLQANVFERPVFARFGRLAAVRDTLERRGAVLSGLTGSGSAVFGIFDREREALRVAGEVRGGPRIAAVLVVPTLTTIPEPVPVSAAPGRAPAS
ncbi:MAG: 4-(cytidine 5'-diphospho)-2-C-methyl-D-erythritol kinase [Gemmatimonadetes bacterium]|nr:4-(cytidine 5'-diphospho)-2-C-methyl-D-erythritol kinase [Gemmatimonadota bacterium]MXX73693.1 4-(cytidine 5'-diphospho)-2-C-methyl-D-erythritol kinase [Gemmatimonadota bacterium]MYC92400.1 4-(cytidine 5'-diphospho)-2-C-methyl-D-erythritol kinase [Gemmatimonadota bacterium]MYG36845.1 4-(cytidine 5'-diphospho)-2-C-methyl-D-erythritol kinase [Gemmatimonadota bacterium]